MPVTNVLTAKIRPLKNTGYVRELKRDGQVPAVIYGKGHENLNIVMERKELTRTFTKLGRHGLFTVETEGQPAFMVQVKEVQMDPIKGHIIHVDFMTVSADEKINALIPIHLLGEAEIDKAGGVLHILLRELPVSSLPGDLPDGITVDMSGMDIGSRVLVKDLMVSDKVEILEDLESMVAQVVAPVTREEEEEAEEEVETEDEPLAE